MRCGSVPLGAASCTSPKAKAAIAAKAWSCVAAGASRSGARLMAASFRLDLRLRDHAAELVILALDEGGEIRAAGGRGKKPLGDELCAKLGRPQGRLERGGKPGDRVRRGLGRGKHAEP